MSEEIEGIESDEYLSEDADENSKTGKKKLRVLNKRVYNKPKNKKLRLQSKIKLFFKNNF